MSRLILKNLTFQQNASYIGFNGEVVNVIGYGTAIHNGLKAGGVLYEKQKMIAGRNLLRNGDFAVQQNGNQWLGVPTSGGYEYIVDGWFYQRGGSSKANVAVSEYHLDNLSDIQRSLRVTTFSGGEASSFSIISQRKAGALVFSGKTLTLSFYAKCNNQRSIVIEVGNDFKSSVVNQRMMIGRADLTTKWQKFVFTFNFPNRPSVMTRGFDHHSWLYFWLEAGDNFNSRTGGINTYSGTFDFADIQLEESEIDTPFERLEYTKSLGNVREYFEKVTSVISLCTFGAKTPSDRVGGYIPYAVPKRKAPSINISYDFIDNPAVFGVSEQGFNVLGDANNEVSPARVVEYTANSEVTI